MVERDKKSNRKTEL